MVHFHLSFRLVRVHVTWALSKRSYQGFGIHRIKGINSIQIIDVSHSIDSIINWHTIRKSIRVYHFSRSLLVVLTSLDIISAGMWSFVKIKVVIRLSFGWSLGLLSFWKLFKLLRLPRLSKLFSLFWLAHLLVQFHILLVPSSLVR